MADIGATTDRRRVSQAQLRRLKEQLLEPLRTTPPTIDAYPREIDVELFRLFSNREWEPVLREKRVTLGGREVRPPARKNEWAYEVHRYWTSDITEWTAEGLVMESGYSTPGEVQADGTFLPIPDVYEVPHYTSNTDHAVSLKHSVIGFSRALLVEELEDDQLVPRWRAKIVVSGQVVAEGETYDCAASIVLAVVSDLIANDGASWWIDVVEMESSASGT